MYFFHWSAIDSQLRLQCGVVFDANSITVSAQCLENKKKTAFKWLGAALVDRDVSIDNVLLLLLWVHFFSFIQIKLGILQHSCPFNFNLFTSGYLRPNWEDRFDKFIEVWVCEIILHNGLCFNHSAHSIQHKSSPHYVIYL